MRKRLLSYNRKAYRSILAKFAKVTGTINPDLLKTYKTVIFTHIDNCSEISMYTFYSSFRGHSVKAYAFPPCVILLPMGKIAFVTL